MLTIKTPLALRMLGQEDCCKLQAILGRVGAGGKDLAKRLYILLCG